MATYAPGLSHVYLEMHGVQFVSVCVSCTSCLSVCQYAVSVCLRERVHVQSPAAWISRALHPQGTISKIIMRPWRSWKRGVCMGVCVRLWKKGTERQEERGRHFFVCFFSKQRISVVLRWWFKRLCIPVRSLKFCQKPHFSAAELSRLLGAFQLQVCLDHVPGKLF